MMAMNHNYRDDSQQHETSYRVASFPISVQMSYRKYDTKYP